MEKSLQFRLFQAALAEREHRLVFQSAPEKPEDEAKKLEERIADPEAKADDLQKEILDFAGKSRDHMKLADDRLQVALDKKTKPERDLKAAKELTSEDNPDWQKIIQGIKPKDGKVDSAALDLAKEKINEARNAIIELADDSDRPKNAIAQAEAYNKLIVDIQALDPDNTVTFVAGIGGAEDDAVLDTAKKQRNSTFDPNGDFEKAVRAYTSSKGGTAASIEIARKGLEAAAKDAKDTIWSLLGSDLKGNKGVPYVNGEQITTVYLDLLKEVNKSVADAKAVVEPASAEKKPDGAKGGAGTPAPSEEKRENPDTVIGELGIGKQVAALKSALEKSGDVEGTLNELNKKSEVKKAPARVAAALNDKFGDKQKFTVKDGKVVLDTSVPAAPVAAETGPANKVEANEKFDLVKIIKMIIEFLKGENISRLEERAENGDINALRGLRNVKKKELRELAKDKEMSKEDKDARASELRKEIGELELRIAEAEQKNNDFAGRLKEQTQGTALQVKQEGGPNKGGAPFLQPRPGATAEQAKPQMQMVFDGVNGEVPGGVRFETVNGKERMYFNMSGYMDIEVSDKPITQGEVPVTVTDAPVPTTMRPRRTFGLRPKGGAENVGESSAAPSATDPSEIPPAPTPLPAESETSLPPLSDDTSNPVPPKEAPLEPERPKSSPFPGAPEDWVPDNTDK